MMLLRLQFATENAKWDIWDIERQPVSNCATQKYWEASGLYKNKILLLQHAHYYETHGHTMMLLRLQFARENAMWDIWDSEW